MLGIKFAPLSIPLERRLQTFAAILIVFLFILAGPLTISLFSCLLLTKYYIIPISYLIWFIYDFKSPSNGGRGSKLARNWFVWRHLKNYFPAKLIKTVELDPNKRYIFGCHPHGILCFSYIINFATEGSGFSKIFKGVNIHLLTLNLLFWMPVLREFALFHGVCAVSSRSIEYILNKLGHSVALVVGGAQEVVDTSPQTMVWYLQKRKGFIRLAIKNGVSLVPVISFGENDLYNIPQSTSIKKFQEFFKKWFMFTPPLIAGRGIFQYSYGIVPFRKPLFTVIGKPIDVEQNDNPTNEEIDKLHKRYINELIELYEQNKNKYSYGNVELIIK